MSVLKWLDHNLEESILILFLGLMTVIMGMQVFARYALGNSLYWSEEITRYLFMWSAFLSISYCTKRCISIKIEQFVDLFPQKGESLFKLLNHTVELLFFFYLLPCAWHYLLTSIESGQVSPACGIPMYYVQAAPFVCFLLAAFRIAQRWAAEFLVVKGEKTCRRS